MGNNILKYEDKKIVIVSKHYLVAIKGYTLYKYNFANKKWERYAKVVDTLNSLLSFFSVFRRLTRAEISKYYKLLDGSELCIARKGIFSKDYNDFFLKKTLNILRGSRPINICKVPNGYLYFGEYFANFTKQAVHIYSSQDFGKTWKIAYTFPKGHINHIHGIFHDKYTDRLWFVTGDREHECIIGYSENGFKSIVEVFRGGQDYRSCVLFFYKDFVVFATDSQYQKNFIKKFDRITLEIITLQEVQGPVIKGTQCGDLSVISTDVEPSNVNKDTRAYVWYTKDGLNWQILYSAEKDWWNPTLFQFGVFDFPTYNCESTDTIYITSKALKGCDNDTLVFNV